MKIKNERSFKTKLSSIFVAFLRAGMLGYGGGPSTIPLIHREVVSRYKWMKDDEFTDILALANTLPGPIATKMAGYIGYRIRGYGGMTIGVLATVAPTVVLLVLLLTTLSSFQHIPWVVGMTKAVGAVVGVMLAVLTWDFIKKGAKDLGWGKNILLCSLSLVAMEWLHIHPGIIIISLMIYVWIPKKKGSEEKIAGGK